MHLPMSKWKRYCSPGPGARTGKRASGNTDSPSRVGTLAERAGVRAKVTPSSVTRFNSGSDMIKKWRSSRRSNCRAAHADIDFFRQSGEETMQKESMATLLWFRQYLTDVTVGQLT
jgi:hypothetical protein